MMKRIWVIMAFVLIAAGACSQELSFDISRVPFSYRGSYLAIHRLTNLLNASAKNEPDGIILRNLSRRKLFDQFIRLEVVEDGKTVTPEIIATPGLLTLKTARGSVQFCFENGNTIRVRGTALGLRMKPLNECYAVEINKRIRLTTGGANGFFWMISPLAGTIEQSGDIPDSTKPNDYSRYLAEAQPGKDGTFELAIENFVSEWQPREYTKNFDLCAVQATGAFTAWMNKMPRFKTGYQQAAKLAAYINWSCLVAARGQMKREGMLMSKNWMNQIWSWDHCFNAIAMAPVDAAVAWDQFACVFDHQSEIGSLPDSFDDEKELWGILKTPVHGWALRKMMENSKMVTPERMRAIYPALVKWTNFWFDFRDPDKNGLPQYNHSYESFDDTPPFDVGLPAEAPELATFLIVQMDVLAEIAARLQKPAEAAKWTLRADALTATLIGQLWKGNKFVARNVNTGKWNEEGDSFLSYVPLLLGKRLPQNIKERLIRDLKQAGGLMTPFGMATESLSSPYFNTNSYTRGSIWAPVNYILVDGLKSCGEKVFAEQIAKTYCAHLAAKEFPERHDARTGEQKSDPEYTWTSSIFLILASQYLNK
ncbi:amylo-alpha-1,6-glucosidase [Deminuibacter soli]|nr:trehalase family glycosidase [Deminuibacter soli]